MNYKILNYIPASQEEYLGPIAFFVVACFTLILIFALFAETTKQRVVGLCIFIPPLFATSVYFHYQALKRPPVYELQVETPNGIVLYRPVPKR